MRSLRTLFALFVILPGFALAQGPTPDILTAEDVLASSERHFPRILQAMAARRQAEGETLTAAGAFDLVFDADGFSRLTGFYDGTAVEGIAKQRIRPLGASLYAGYKISDGDFP
ncbi:MAG: multidrug transporter, partial [Pseudomonadota bacterium]